MHDWPECREYRQLLQLEEVLVQLLLKLWSQEHGTAPQFFNLVAV